MIQLSEQERQLLKDAVRERRLALGKAQGDIANEVGVSLSTWSLIETAGRDRYRDLTLSAVFRALGWRSDALDFILKRESIPAEDAYDPPLRLAFRKPGEAGSLLSDMSEVLDAASEETGRRALEGDPDLVIPLGRAILSQQANQEDEMDQKLGALDGRLTRLEAKVDQLLADDDEGAAQ